MPFVLMTAAASGVARDLIRALAASGCLAAALTPAVFTNQLCNSPGRTPTICTPLTDSSVGMPAIASGGRSPARQRKWRIGVPASATPGHPLRPPYGLFGRGGSTALSQCALHQEASTPRTHHCCTHEYSRVTGADRVAAHWQNSPPPAPTASANRVFIQLRGALAATFPDSPR